MTRAAGLLALLVSAAVPSLAAARAPTGGIEHVPGRLVPVFAGASPATFRLIALPSRALHSGTSSSLAQTSTIQVTYHNFSAKAQAAFQAAVDVWQSILVSDQVIHVDASWVDLGSASGILGQAGANNLYLDNDGFWYPGALEDARCHCNRDPGPEISAQFNSAFPSWYKGTDGLVPSGKWDLETVVLHELGHGFGFFSSFYVFGTKGYWGYIDSHSVNHPLRFDYDEWSAAASGQRMTTFADGSTTLKTQLDDGSVSIGGTNVEAALGGRAKLYAPGSWQDGSSNSHFDESAYPRGTVNSLMTPVLNDGEATHAPGPAAVGVLADIGWTVAGASTPPSAPQTVTATAGDGSADVAWSAPVSDGGSTVTGYTATSAPGGVTCTTTGALGCTVSGLTNGTQYTFTVTAANGVGTGALSSPSNPVVPHTPSSDVTGPVVDTPVVNIVAPQTMGSAVKVLVSWPDAADDSGIAAYELQREDGAGPWVSVSLDTPTSTSAGVNVTRGSNTAFRVRATDGAGNTGSWTTAPTANVATLQETSSSVVYSAGWTRVALTGAAGGYVEQSATANATATFMFTGTSVGFVTTVAVARGVVEITLDGTDVTLVDLYSPTKKTKTVAWSPDSPLVAGMHTVELRVTGSRNVNATSARIDIDAFLVWP